MSAILTGSNFVFPVITFAYVARILGADGTGQVAFSQSIVSYFAIIATLGVPAYGLRECAKVRDNKEELSHLVQELLLISLISTVSAYFLLFLCLVFIPALFDYRVLILLLSLSLILTTAGCEWLYKSLEEYSYITIRSVAFKVAALLLAFVFIRNSSDVVWYAFITLVAGAGSYICNFVGLKKRVRFKKLRPYCLKQHLRPIFTMLASAVVITIYGNFDSTMLGIMSGAVTVGFYNAAQKIRTAILSLSTAITNAFIPRMANRVGADDYDELKRLSALSLRVSLFAMAPVAVFVALDAEACVSLVCGDGFSEAIPILYLLILGVIPLTLTNLFGNQLLIPLGQEKRFAFSVTVGLFINLTLNIVLIPILGAVGAALGTLATETWNAIWMGLGVGEFARYMGKNTPWKCYVIPVVLSACVLFLIGLFTTQLNIILKLVVDALVFFVLTYSLFYVMKEPLIRAEVSIIRRKVLLNTNKDKDK